MLKPDMMLEATRLTRAGQLTEATALLQRMFRGDTARNMSAGEAGDPALAATIIDRTAEAIDETGAHTAAPLNISVVLRGFFDHVGRCSNLKNEDLMPSGPVSRPDIVPPGGKYIEGTYRNLAGTRTYKLYIPSRYQVQALPLIVMLHGCTQSPDDFAAGTRMNFLAEEQNCFFVYPEQTIV